VLRDTEEEVVGHLAAVVEHGDSAFRVERADAAARDELDLTLPADEHRRYDGEVARQVTSLRIRC
jgi:hypothetical protein